MKTLLHLPRPIARRAGQIPPIHGVTVTQDNTNVVRFTTGMNIDADGAPTAYSLIHNALDVVADAGYPNKSWRDVLVEDPKNPSKPFVDPQGYLVSMTTYKNLGFADTDHASWVDASTVPYSVINPIVRQKCKGVCIGCLVFVSYNGLTVEAVCADVSGENSIGEGSIALAKMLGIPSSALNGGVSHGVNFAFHCGVPALINGKQYQLQAA